MQAREREEEMEPGVTGEEAAWTATETQVEVLLSALTVRAK